MSKGFTLIEVLIASLILVLFSSFMFYMVGSSLRNVESSNEYLKAVLRASSVLEDVRKAAFTDTEDLYDDGFDEGKGRVVRELRGADIYEISVEYDWRESRRPINLMTLRSRYQW
ncbi:prepilin-type N-terminal cleavage/methylation domain-containing protein [Candidatus Margulisiibacteriota bacterium]